MSHHSFVIGHGKVDYKFQILLKFILNSGDKHYRLIANFSNFSKIKEVVTIFPKLLKNYWNLE